MVTEKMTKSNTNLKKNLDILPLKKYNRPITTANSFISFILIIYIACFTQFVMKAVTKNNSDQNLQQNKMRDQKTAS